MKKERVPQGGQEKQEKKDRKNREGEEFGKASYELPGEGVTHRVARGEKSQEKRIHRVKVLRMRSRRAKRQKSRKGLLRKEKVRRKAKEREKKASTKEGNLSGLGRSTSLPVDVNSSFSLAATSAAEFFQEGSTGPREPNAPDSGMGRAVKNSELENQEWGTFGQLYKWLEPRVDVYLDRLCKTSPMGRIFPLPSSPRVLSQISPSHSTECLCVLRCLVCALNSLNGEGSGQDTIASEMHRKVLAGLVRDCERVVGWKVVDIPP